MSKIKVMAGDIPQGDWTFSAGPLNSGVISLSSLSHPNVALRVISVQQISETHLKKFIPTAAWGVLGYGLLGPLGSIAGMLSGGNRSTVYFACSLLDGRSFIGATDTKTFQQLLAIAFDGSRTGMDLVQMGTDSPSLPISNVESTGGSQQIPGRGKPFEIDEAKLASDLSPKADSSGLLPVLLWLTLIGLLIGLIYLVSNSGSTVKTGKESVSQPSDSPTVVSNSAVAEWTAVKDTGNLPAFFYYDPATIHKVGNKVKMWNLVDLVKANYFLNVRYMSQKVEHEFDCKEEQSRILAFSFHSEGMGKGKVVYTASTPNAWWEPVSPTSVDKTLWKIACGKTDPKEPKSPPAAATNTNKSGYPTAWVFPEAAPVNPPAASHNQAETPVDCYALSKLGEARGDNFIVVADTVRNARRKGLCVDYPR